MSAASAEAPRASFARRLAALLYESLLVAAIVLIAGFLTLPFTPHGGGLTIPSGPVRLGGFLLVVAVIGLYCVHFWTAHRRTLAMKTWGLRLARRDGSPVDRGRAWLRYGAAWIGPAVALAAYVALRPHPGARYALLLAGLNLAWALVDRDRQFLHDRLAGTVVLRDRPPLSRPKP